MRAKPRSSLVAAHTAVAEGRADAVLSAGNTGALMAMAKLALRTMEGIDRPALVALIFYSAWSIGRVAFDSSGPILLALGAYAVLRFSRLHPAFIIAASGLVGFLFL